MRKAITILLALVMVLSLAACGGGSATTNTPAATEAPAPTEAPATPAQTEESAPPEPTPEPTPEPVPEPAPEPAPEPTPEIPKYSVGDTVSTDIFEFTLKNLELSYYASALDDGSFATAIDHDDGESFVASTGRSLTCLSFDVYNKDRGSNSIGDGGSGDWGLKTLSIVSDDNEYKIKGYDYNNNDGAGGLRLDMGTINGQRGRSHNYIMDARSTVTIQVVGVITIDKDDLPDEYIFRVGIPNSSSEVEYFDYLITK